MSTRTKRSSPVVVSASCAAVLLSGLLWGCDSGKTGDEESRAKAHFNLGTVLTNTGQHAEAIQEFEKAVAIKPDFAEAHYNMGVAYGKLGKYAEALAPYTKAIAVKPNYTDAYHNRAIAHYFTRDYDKAWADVKACRKFGDKLPPDFLAALRRASGREE